ncbi:hypothetical protein NDU88_006125 [Pleurodeles waltl]|uniref:Apolipoprotein A-I n=2 Tax=Pleurodeles waltl TaxID=8319 RepID=A0AAV7UP29_PLEWA|nr:hypothetical protein NDU88_006125 [Pleurodeles waltl]
MDENPLPDASSDNDQTPASINSSSQPGGSQSRGEPHRTAPAACSSEKLGKMRCVVVALTALLLLTGTQARFVWQNEEPQGPTERAKEIVQNYVKQALQLGKEAISQVESSEYGKKLDLKILDKLEIFSTNAQHLQKQLTPYIEQAREQVAKEYERDLSVAKEKIQPILEGFQKRWEEDVKAYQRKLTPVAAGLQKQAKTSLEALSKELLPIAEEFRDKLRADVDHLRVTITPHLDGVRQQVTKKLEELRAKAGPQAEEYRAQMSSQIDAWREKFGPIAQQLKERLIPHAEEVQSKLNSIYEALKAQLSPAA